MVFQSYALYPHMSVEDNLAFGLKRRSVDARRNRASRDRRCRHARACRAAHRKPHALSGGQRQRVALGRAIVRDPKVFLFDEPLSNLDASLRVSTRGEIGKLHRRLGATMIYVTHDQVEAMTLGQRICIMNGGKDRASWPAARGLQAAGQHLCGLVPRQSAHEPVAGSGRRRQRSAGGQARRGDHRAQGRAIPARCRREPRSRWAFVPRALPSTRTPVQRQICQHRRRDRASRVARCRDHSRRAHPGSRERGDGARRRGAGATVGERRSFCSTSPPSTCSTRPAP